MLDELRKLKCAMCGELMEHKQHGHTHIYVCEACPMLCLEYFDLSNLSDLKDYLLKT